MYDLHATLHAALVKNVLHIAPIGNQFEIRFGGADMKMSYYSRNRFGHFANLCFAVALLGTSAIPASAAFLDFTNRDAFLASAGTTSTETFDAVAIDSQFRTQPVNVGSFTLTGVGTNQDPDNIINPSGMSNYNVNGSSFVLGITNVSASGFTLTFESPIHSFGADFRGFNNFDTANRSLIFVNGTALSPPVVSTNTDLSFFGFVSDDPFTTVSILRDPDYLRPDSSDVFGMDNVTFAEVSAVPEPSTWAMMILGFAAIGAMTYRKRQTQGGALAA
jgi:hypothetical protein